MTTEIIRPLVGKEAMEIFGCGGSPVPRGRGAGGPKRLNMECVDGNGGR